MILGKGQPLDLWKLAEQDLNLLVVFNALMHERSLTRTGMRLGRTQSALSHSLRRLRELLQDPLFVRSADGLIPTARAELVAPQVETVLRQIQAVLQKPRPFDPVQDKAQLSVVMTDYAQLVLLPPLLQRLSQEAPGVTLRVLSGSDAIEQQLEQGEADLGFGVVIFERPDLYQFKLFEERFVCLVREDHPVLSQGLDLAAFVQLHHVLVTPRGRPGSFVDAALEHLGLTRKVVMFVPQYMVVPEVIAHTDLIATLPERVALWAARRLPVKQVEPPLALPGFATRLVWHERRQLDPACAWLRGLIKAVCEQQQTPE